MSGNSAFFDKPQAAAILKHQVLFRHLKVFASKTGSQSDGRVCFVDGYAGAGTAIRLRLTSCTWLGLPE
jgi:hypothetical protein